MERPVIVKPTNTKVPAYVINLDGSVDRLDAVSQALAAAGIDFERVPAVDGRSLRLQDVEDCDYAKALRIYGRALTGGEYGCYKSHLECARRMLEDGHEAALVFEDDISIDQNMLAVVQEALKVMDDIGNDWRLVNLGAPPRIASAVATLSSGHTLLAAHYFPQTAHALLWSRKGAKQFVEQYSRVEMTADNLFRHVLVREGGGYAISPPLARQEGFSSIIDTGKQNQRYADRRWNYGLLKQKRFWVNRIIAAYRKATFRKGLG
jgi:glycosyl transferase family 25